ncbi:hypothetical protein F8M41_004128 [Gigaspora margarita]|uniref:Uncharacterized protein n=1 Tax=Gigaspora margarita TaxID=4874 RepID=A0A8H3XA86_GIGMA|nr:hypothetical protein F8M41_004128 [Gigaspora margarita]
MWVLLEEKASAVEVDVDQKNYMTHGFNLDCLKTILCERFKVLKNVEPEDIEFFTFNDRINPIPPDITLNSLSVSTTATAPLVVRYLFSTSTIIVHCNLLTLWFKSGFPHTSGIWYLIRNAAKSKFQILRLDTVQYSFIHNENNSKLLIETEFQFNEIIADVQPNEKGKREVSISIQVTDNLPRSNLPIPEETIVQLIAELKKRKSAFAVTHVQDETKKLLLKAEEWIDGTKAYGPIEYLISIEEVLVLVQEVKKDDFEKGTAQNISRKRRIEINPRDEEVPVVMYGIVTNALQWYFLRWAGSSDNPTVELSGPHICEFDSNTMEQVKIILSCITSILQYQVRGYDDVSKRTHIKRRHTS